jgi:hypothetical protein
MYNTLLQDPWKGDNPSTDIPSLQACFADKEQWPRPGVSVARGFVVLALELRWT